MNGFSQCCFPDVVHPALGCDFVDVCSPSSHGSHGSHGLWMFMVLFASLNNPSYHVSLHHYDSYRANTG